MAGKKKLNLASAQANKLMSELHAKRGKIAAQVQFRKKYYRFKNVLITKMNSTDYKVRNKCQHYILM